MFNLSALIVALILGVVIYLVVGSLLWAVVIFVLALVLFGGVVVYGGNRRV